MATTNKGNTMTDITDASAADIDLIFVIALIKARAADFGAPVYDGEPMICAELVTRDRLPMHPLHLTDPTFSRIHVNVCGGMPVEVMKRKRAHAAAADIAEVVNTPIVFVGLTGTDR